MTKNEKAAVTIEKALVLAVYEARRDRERHPEGKTDNAGRWYPTAREDAGGDGSSTRCPSRAWPWSYMHRCRTRAHCAVLVARALDGRDVPPDVAAVVAAFRASNPSFAPYRAPAVEPQPEALAG